MPTLEWIGKEKVVNHHRDVPYCVLDRKYSFDSAGQHEEDNGSENMIIHGDNLYALKSLLPKYEGRINCIYIDPPYNTGNEGWVYNDNVNDPQIKKWLGEVVGKEGEDLTRHDKWLCMMYPRLKLLKKLLCDNGTLIISIGFHELNNLMMISREIFSNKQITSITVQTSGGKPSAGFNYLHEYLVFVSPIDFKPNKLLHFGGIERSPFEGLTLSTFNKISRPNQAYPIFIDTQTLNIVGVGKTLDEKIKSGEYVGDSSEYEFVTDECPFGSVAVWPITTKGKDCVWRLIPPRLLSDWKKGYIKVTKGKGKKANTYSIQYLPDGLIQKIESGTLEIIGKEKNSPTLILGKNETEGSEVPTIWQNTDFYTVNGTSLLLSMFGEKKFDYPKSLGYIMEVISSIADDGDIILDSFAGSGTTGHAALELNALDGKKRKYILIETMPYAEELTSERIKKVIAGYNDVPGIDSDFSFYELGKPLLTEDDLLNEEVPIEKIREYIFYTETNKPFIEPKSDNMSFIGSNEITAYYFHYSKNESTVLDDSFIAILEKGYENHVIYADACTIPLSVRKKFGIVFKKIPRDIERL